MKVRNFFVITWTDLTQEAQDDIREMLESRLNDKYPNKKPLKIADMVESEISNFEAKGSI